MTDLRALLDKATPGPWRWHGQIGPHHEIGLRTVGNGVLYVISLNAALALLDSLR